MATTTKKTMKKKRKKKTAAKGTTGAKKAGSRRPRRDANFPATTLEDALALAQAIQKHGAGQKIRRLTVFDEMGRSPESGPSRLMITNSSRYGLTTGGYQAEFLELTDQGQIATSPESSARARRRSLFDLAVENMEPFKHLYGNLIGKRVPSPQVMRDNLEDANVSEENRKECVDVFLENAKYLGLLRSIAGAERLISIDQVLEELPGKVGSVRVGEEVETKPQKPAQEQPIRKSQSRWAKTCFVISPIAEQGEEERKHADMILSSLIERALEEDDLEVVRADGIGDPGMISGQVIEYLLKSGLVIADLSFHNPNVFYELAIRHMAGLPTVHLIRKQDHIPFDLKDFRTIQIDTSDKYELVSQLDTYRSEIANHVRIALTSGAGSNPIRTFAPSLEVSVPSGGTERGRSTDTSEDEVKDVDCSVTWCCPAPSMPVKSKRLELGFPGGSS